MNSLHQYDLEDAHLRIKELLDKVEELQSQLSESTKAQVRHFDRLNGSFWARVRFLFFG